MVHDFHNRVTLSPSLSRSLQGFRIANSQSFGFSARRTRDAMSSPPSSSFPTIRWPRFLSLLLFFFLVLTYGALGGGRHIMTIPSSTFRSPRALAWDPTAQHFLVGSSLFPAALASVSDAGVTETLVFDPILPAQSSVVALAVDDRRRRLFVGLTNPSALAAYDLRSPRPHRRIFLSPLPDPSAALGGVAVDHATGAAFVTAGSVVAKVDLDGAVSVLSRSTIFSADPSSEGLGGLVHGRNAYLLVAERGGAGRVFRVDDENGGTKEVLGKALASAAEGIALRADGGAVMARGGAGARWLRSRDAWSEAVIEDEAAVEEGWLATAVAVREGRRAYVLVTPAEEGGGEKGSRIEEVEWRKEREEDTVWLFVLIGAGFAIFLYWRYQMRQLVTNMNKKIA
ncbi:uncharacterized protein LOC122032565 [Zingiber officinale]|uniref:uncharacterized protein LOC122032565 n=1 Tax=Zingiber officinale TaxID=94328 RepID=UPI001C4D11D7|nr:uncharacterized protein LOC122032565 [Zingiber officinale]XP_042447806.1 uncharacterized protein LOC122032565 [Zingiber officinale]